MGIERRQRATPAAGLLSLRILVPVVVSWNDMDRIDAVRAEEDFTEAGAIERAIVGVGIDDAASTGVPSQVLYQQLRASEDFHGDRRGQTARATMRALDGCRLEDSYGMADPVSTISKTGDGAKKAVSQCRPNR